MYKPNFAVGLKALAGARSLIAKEGLVSIVNIDRRLISIGIFFGAALTLLFYLLALRFRVDFPTPLFFISIAVVAGSLLYQILFTELAHGFAGTVILQITLAAIVFHLIYQVPNFGLYGSDAYYDMSSMKAIMESGHLAGVSEYVQITTFFPVIHVMGAELSLITGIDEFSVAKWFPSVIGSLTIPMIYLLVRHLYKKEKAALFAAFLFACIQHYIMFGSLFVRETVGLILAISCVYFYIASRSSQHPLAFRILALLCLGGTIIAHHLTTLMLLILLLFYWGFTVLARYRASRQKLPEYGEVGGISLSLVLIGATGTLFYWLTTVVEPVQIGLFYLDSMLSPNVWGARTILDQNVMGMALPSLRYYFLVYGSYICYAIFGIMLIYKSFTRHGEHNIETPAFTLYLVLCGVLGFMSYFVLPPTVGGDRFLAFGWLFAFGPLALALIEFRNKFIIGISAVVVLSFIFINLYTIHPTIWDPDSSGVGGSATKEDFALAETVDFSKGEVIGYQNNVVTIYEIQNKMGTDAFFLTEGSVIDRYKWIIVNRPGLEEEGLYSEFTKEVIREMERLETSNSPDYNRIYESNNLAVFRQR